MAFRANHVQTAEFTHQRHLLHVFLKGIHSGLLFFFKLNRQAFNRCQTLRHGHVIGIQIAVFCQNLVEFRKQVLRQLATQFDVNTATSHVGGDGHCANRTGLGDNQGFFGVLARVEPFVLLGFNFEQLQ